MTLVTTGAFGLTSNSALADMSMHKWRKLLMAAERLGVLPYVAEGVARMKDDALLPEIIVGMIAEKKDIIEQQRNDTYNYSNAKLYNVFTSRRWEGVINEETSSNDISEVTLNLLDIIVANMDDMVVSDITMPGMITLGRFLRENKNVIDYAKLLRWLSHIGLVQVAQLEGSILIECFGFTQEELPFVTKIQKKAGKHLLRVVEKAFTSHSFSTATRMNVAMLETVSNRFMRAVTTITDIEE